MNNCLILITLVVALSLNVYCKPPSSMDKSSAVDRSKKQLLKPHPFGKKIEAEDFDYTNGATINSCHDDKSKRITNLVDNTIVGYFGVDFGNGAKKLRIRYGDGHPPGTIFTTKKRLKPRGAKNKINRTVTKFTDLLLRETYMPPMGLLSRCPFYDSKDVHQPRASKILFLTGLK
ncbi:hypothetical protein CHUAL_013984 [Chamberlinius hualienensis]